MSDIIERLQSKLSANTVTNGDVGDAIEVIADLREEMSATALRAECAAMELDLLMETALRAIGADLDNYDDTSPEDVGQMLVENVELLVAAKVERDTLRARLAALERPTGNVEEDVRAMAYELPPSDLGSTRAIRHISRWHLARVAAAVGAERERCAGLCDGAVIECVSVGDSDGGDVAHFLATAIRRGEAIRGE